MNGSRSAARATARAAIEVLSRRLQPKRFSRLNNVLNQRTSSVRLVCENLADPHNGAACLRTADSFGVQNVHFIEGLGTTPITDDRAKVDGGSHKWLTVRKHQRPWECVEELKEEGYRILVSDLAPGAVPITEMEFNPGERVAVVLGNEHRGTSRYLREAADARYVLPARGFVQSFNLSVACALTLQALDWKGVMSERLLEEEKDEILLTWMLREVKAAPLFLEREGIHLDII